MDMRSARRPTTLADALLGLTMPTHMQSADAAMFVIISIAAQNIALVILACRPTIQYVTHAKNNGGMTLSMTTSNRTTAEKYAFVP